MEKVKNGMKLWISKLKEMWLSIVISCGVWSVLVYLWDKGVRGFLFTLLNFFTGALLSVDGKNVLGGVIGRTLILMVFNTLISSLLIHKGKFKTRFAFAKEDFKSGLKNLSEYVSSFSLFATKQKDIIFSGVMGIGLSIIWNAFISGNGELVNTFSCIALFIILLEQFETKSGFFVAVVNLCARKLGYKNICGDAVVAFIEAFMAGCLLMPILAFLQLSGVAYVIGILTFVVGMIGLLWEKGVFKKFIGMFLLICLLIPNVQAEAGGLEYTGVLKQGTFKREDSAKKIYTTTISDVVVNGERRTEDEIVLLEGDICSFVVRTNDIDVLSFSRCAMCSKCSSGENFSYLIQKNDTIFGMYERNNFSAEYIFENVEISDGYIAGELSGEIFADCRYIKDESGYFDMCRNCDGRKYEKLHAGGAFISNNSFGSGNIKMEFSGVELTGEAQYDREKEYLYIQAAEKSPNMVIDATWDGNDTTQIKNDEKVVVRFYRESILRTIFNAETEIYYPDAGEEIVDDDNDDISGITGENTEIVGSVPLNTAVAILASVAVAGAAVTFTAPITSVIESVAGMNKKKGQLVVNGDVDVPTVHYAEYENVMIPVNVAEGDGIVWGIAAVAITPDDEKLVKSIAVPTSSTSAEIKLEIQREPKEAVTTYIEVTALGVEVTGEHYFHETMIEVNIEV